MCFSAAQARLAIAAFIVDWCVIGAAPAVAQTRVTTLQELRGALSPGDVVTIVPAIGEAIAGRLTRVGEGDLDVRVVGGSALEGDTPRDVITLRLDRIQSLERPRDSARNGALIGAGIGTGFGGALFAYGFAVDRNEAGEWAPLYGGVAAVGIGVGALIGLAVDAASSKPHIIYGPADRKKTSVSVQPLSRGPGLVLVVSF